MKHGSDGAMPHGKRARADTTIMEGDDNRVPPEDEARWRAIVARASEPWTDDDFPPSKKSIDGKAADAAASRA